MSVCVHVCVCVCMCVWVGILMCACAQFVCDSVHIYLHVCIRVSVHKYVQY